LRRWLESCHSRAHARGASIASTLVMTKVAAPRLRGALVPRPRLTEIMDAGSEAALTLVSAPAGFGKTTVLASWLARASAQSRTVACVSLDEADRNPSSFWLYVVTALQAVAPSIGSSILPLLSAGQPATRTMLTAVLNEIGAQPNEVDLILDDYHLADSAEVAEGMTFLLDHQPPNLHLVVSTRADPDLPLARLRARGDLVEIRARDLRFTANETTSYLADVGGLNVAPGEVAALESRTEGWAAALQLASLSMQGRDDIGAFVEGFAGTDRYVVDYLADEVLSRQSDEVREFLERTSILELLNGDLCDSVLARTGSRAMLERLERANLFLIPLDDHRSWYRYHHLFADVLQSHLRSERPEVVPGLHLRASLWHESIGDPVSAVRHALAAGHVDRAADLIEGAAPALRRNRQEATLRRWIDDVPDEVVQRRPVVAVNFIGALMSSNEFGDVARRLHELEQQLPAIRAFLAPEHDPQGNEVHALDPAELARIPAALELYWAGLALMSGDFTATHHHAEQATQLATAADDVVPAGAAGLSGLAYWACGELDEARRSYVTCIEGLRRADHLSDAIGCYLTVAEIQMTQGRLRDARVTYEEAERLATRSPDAPLRGSADIQIGLGQLAVERGDLDSARLHLSAAADLGEERGLPQYAYRSRAVNAMLAEATGDIAGALELVLQAQQVYLGDFSPNVRPLHATATRLRIRLGDLDEGEHWAQRHDVTVTQELSYLREFEHLTLAEAMLARASRSADPTTLAETDHLLERLLAVATTGGRDATVIELLLLQAATAQVRGDVKVAQSSNDQAVQLAAPEGEINVFARHRALISALLEPPATTEIGPSATSDRIVEPLSPRELEVLQLLATELDGPEIAQRLFVSLNTLRTHTKSIYSKLGVNSRRSAVRRGRELGLLAER
jgi:LuxR family maltose regulon positive regulatory protein